MNRYKSIITWSLIFLIVVVFLFALYRVLTPHTSSNNFPLNFKWSQEFDDQVIEMSVLESTSFAFIRTLDRLYAIDVRTGNLIWEINISHQVDPSPARVSNGSVFLADQNMLWKLDHENGQVIWSQPLSYSNGHVVSASSQVVLVNETSAYIHSYDANTGLLLWSIPTGRGPIQAYVDESTIYIPDQSILGVDALSGRTLWNEIAISIGNSDYSDGVVYYITENVVVAFDTHQRSELWRADFGFSNVGFPGLKIENSDLFILDGNGVGLVDKKTGDLIWHVSISQPSNITVIDNNVFILEGINRVIHAVDAETGNELGTLGVSTQRLWFTDSQDMIATDRVLLVANGNKISGYER